MYYTYNQLQQMLVEIPTLDAEQLREKYLTDTHEDAILGIHEYMDTYFPEPEPNDEQTYWDDYADDMLIERRKERNLLN